MSVRDSHGNGKDGHAEDQSKDGYVEDHRRCRFVKGSPGLVGAWSSSWRMAPPRETSRVLGASNPLGG
jgi:hypothetical protein